MRILLVDGPQHGNSLNVEGQPDDFLYFPCFPFFTAKMVSNEENGSDLSFMRNYMHVYSFRDKTDATLVYHYRGSK